MDDNGAIIWALPCHIKKNMKDSGARFFVGTCTHCGVPKARLGKEVQQADPVECGRLVENTGERDQFFLWSGWNKTGNKILIRSMILDLHLNTLSRGIAFWRGTPRQNIVSGKTQWDAQCKKRLSVCKLFAPNTKVQTWKHSPEFTWLPFGTKSQQFRLNARPNLGLFNALQC